MIVKGSVFLLTSFVVVFVFFDVCAFEVFMVSGIN